MRTAFNPLMSNGNSNRYQMKQFIIFKGCWVVICIQILIEIVQANSGDPDQTPC